MSNHRKGSQRDNLIVQAVDAYKVLDTEQIRIMFFHGIKRDRRTAQERLAILSRRGRLKRGREAVDQPYHYYIQRQGQVAHRVGVNWVRLWLTGGLKSWESIHSFGYEIDYGTLRCDGFAAVQNKVTGKMLFYFVEYDHATSNQFDKVTKYNRLFEQQPETWWTNLTDRFPAIIVVTSRVHVIRKKVEQENTHGLEFRIYEFEQMRGECLERGKV